MNVAYVLNQSTDDVTVCVGVNIGSGTFGSYVVLPAGQLGSTMAGAVNDYWIRLQWNNINVGWDVTNIVPGASGSKTTQYINGTYVINWNFETVGTLTNVLVVSVTGPSNSDFPPVGTSPFQLQNQGSEPVTFAIAINNSCVNPSDSLGYVFAVLGSWQTLVCFSPDGQNTDLSKYVCFAALTSAGLQFPDFASKFQCSINSSSCGCQIGDAEPAVSVPNTVWANQAGKYLTLTCSQTGWVTTTPSVSPGPGPSPVSPGPGPSPVSPGPGSGPSPVSPGPGGSSTPTSLAPGPGPVPPPPSSGLGVGVIAGIVVAAVVVVVAAITLSVVLTKR
jgi:hypothetical protein